MPRAPHKCPSCSQPAPAGQRYCSTHRAEHERRRGTRAQRGYGGSHRALRSWWQPQVEAGTVHCWRCRVLIRPGESWHLGHDDVDRSQHRGPEHQLCNTSAAGTSAH